MNKDYHYYGTYAAAKIAGYADEEALVIARAAQFVDEATQSDFPENYTVQTPGEIVRASNVPWGSNEKFNAMNRAWIPFHFLPGNVDEIAMRALSKEPEIKLKANLICGPNGYLTESIIKDAEDTAYRNKDLEMLGIRCHVLADTFAHQGFAGIHEYKINEVVDVSGVAGGDTKKLSTFAYTPPMISNQSASYLGHGRCGHYPDICWLAFQYKRKISGNIVNEVIRSNPNIFKEAFTQMVLYLRTAANHKAQKKEDIFLEFDHVTWKLIKHALIKPIGDPSKGISDEKADDVNNDDCPTFLTLLPALGFAEPIPYDYKNLKNANGFLNRFFVAAEDHRKFVRAGVLEKTDQKLDIYNIY